MNTQKMLEETVNRLRDIVQGDDGQAYKEANKFLLSYDALKFNESAQTPAPQPKTATLVIDEHGSEMQISLREDGKYDLLGAFYTLPVKETKSIEFVPVTEMVLLCPQCHRQHIDRDLWETRPHKTHLCEFCNHGWRPFEYYTVGVEMKNPPYNAPFTEDVPQCCGNPAIPPALTDQQCDAAAAQTMDRIAASHRMHAMHINPNIETHDTLRRELIRAGAMLAAAPQFKLS